MYVTLFKLGMYVVINSAKDYHCLHNFSQILLVRYAYIELLLH